MRALHSFRYLSLVTAGFLAATGLGWWILGETAFSYSSAQGIPAVKEQVSIGANSSPDGRTDDPSADNFISVDVKTRGYCLAGSNVQDDHAPGGFYNAPNKPRAVTKADCGSGLFLLAQPGVATTWYDKPGMRIVLVNKTDKLIEFPACDSRLSIMQEARDADGTWKPIEYLPSSWCGNSYHTVFLEPAKFWEFPAPRYKGSTQTKLRVAMKLSDGSMLYSNEFDGSINPGQFTQKQGHKATNIMDPYND